MDDVLRLLEILVSFAGPIAVAWFAARQEKDRKENARIKELEKEQAAQKETEMKKKFDDITKRLDELGQKLDEVSDKVESLEGVDERYGISLRELRKQHTLSWQYTHELAQLIMVLAAGMRDQHLDGNITKAIARCQDFEHSALSQFMTTGETE